MRCLFKYTARIRNLGSQVQGMYHAASAVTAAPNLVPWISSIIVVLLVVLLLVLGYHLLAVVARHTPAARCSQPWHQCRQLAASALMTGQSSSITFPDQVCAAATHGDRSHRQVQVQVQVPRQRHTSRCVTAAVPSSTAAISWTS